MLYDYGTLNKAKRVDSLSYIPTHNSRETIAVTIALDWHHLANTIKGSAHGDDVALFFECGGQIRLTS